MTLQTKYRCLRCGAIIRNKEIYAPCSNCGWRGTKAPKCFRCKRKLNGDNKYGKKIRIEAGNSKLTGIHYVCKDCYKEIIENVVKCTNCGFYQDFFCTKLNIERKVDNPRELINCDHFKSKSEELNEEIKHLKEKRRWENDCKDNRK